MAPSESVVNLPVGFKFRPRDDQLLGYYLLNKVRGTSFMYENVIPEMDLYGKTEPWDIWHEYGGHNLAKGEDLYFFTKLKSLSDKDSRVARTIGSGTWKGENSGTTVSDPKNEENDLGIWKRFHYENPKSVQDGCWIMHEYSLHPSLVNPKPNSTNQFVLCRIRKNDKGKRKLRTAEEDNETDPPVQSQNKRQRPQQVNFEEFIGNCTPMSEATGIGGSVSYLPTGLTQSQPDSSFAYPTTVVSSQARANYTDDVSQFHGGGDGDALMSDFSHLDTAQPFTEQALGSYAVCNQERALDVYETQQGLGLTDNNIGHWPSPFGSEEDQVNAFDFSIDYDLLIHLINCDDGPPQSSTAQFMGMENTTSASSEANMVIID
ncbi:NAC transcription factor 29-like [Prunus yedoensis var. nudiflora]|uniref:NAC transcription factor 29-like n=1 Tax=Prunus yedoensis var. nudiflora TaxID=2094558 RepID=A0A314UHD9_PRUYE|nr:NAC transcription factor 29-like [Prunus yedoensis var. nudiflora]